MVFVGSLGVWAGYTTKAESSVEILQVSVLWSDLKVQISTRI